MDWTDCTEMDGWTDGWTLRLCVCVWGGMILTFHKICITPPTKQKLQYMPEDRFFLKNCYRYLICIVLNFNNLQRRCLEYMYYSLKIECNILYKLGLYEPCTGRISYHGQYSSRTLDYTCIVLQGPGFDLLVKPPNFSFLLHLLYKYIVSY